MPQTRRCDNQEIDKKVVVAVAADGAKNSARPQINRKHCSSCVVLQKQSLVLDINSQNVAAVFAHRQGRQMELQRCR